MTAAHNAERMRRGYQAFNEGDVATLLDLFAEELVWHFPGTSKFAGDHIGRDASLAMLGGFGAQSDGTFRAELHDVAGSDGYAMGWATDSAQRNGRTLEVSAVLVFRMVDGRVVEAWHHFDDTRQIDEFWS